jgi:plasmid maintenance system antidote protein VapI
MNYCGLQIIALLKMLDWNQNALALHLHKSAQYISDICRNKKKLSDKLAEEIARIGGLSLEQFKQLDYKPTNTFHEKDINDQKSIADAMQFLNRALDRKDINKA